jgi:hypothetical protein
MHGAARPGNMNHALLQDLRQASPATKGRGQPIGEVDCQLLVYILDIRH